MKNEEAIEVLEGLWKYEHSGFSEKDIREALNMAIEALKQTSGDLISRQAVINKIAILSNEQGNKLIEAIKDLPSAEKTAEWIKQKSGDELFPEEIVCSKCYHSNSHLDFDEHNNPIGKVFLESKYCPWCGGKNERGGMNDKRGSD